MKLFSDKEAFCRNASLDGTTSEKNVMNAGSALPLFFSSQMHTNAFKHFWSMTLQFGMRTHFTTPGLPDFSWHKIPKREKIYQITANYTKCP
jgi:hypothetical protein